MKPLLFLTSRSLFNGVKRAFSSPKRALGVLFFLAYYTYIFRPFGGRAIPRGAFPSRMQLDFPALRIVEAVTFGIFVLATLMLMLGLAAPRGGFRQADVDVLFPTPVKQTTVLSFRLVRDSFFTLLVPLIVLLFVYRPAQEVWTSFFRSLPSPSSSRLLFRAAMGAYLLTSIAWISLGYAFGTYLNRPEARFDALRKLVNAGVVTLVAGIGLYVYLAVRDATDAAPYLALAENPALRVIFFTATAATWLTMAPLLGSWDSFAAGSGVLLGSTVLGIGLAMKQAGHLYEQAAARAAVYESARQTAGRGDVYGMLASRARQGKFRARRSRLAERLWLRGPSALLWKEYLIQVRASRSALLFLPLYSIGMTLFPVLLIPERRSAVAGPILLAMQAVFAFMISASLCSMGFLETLRRVDLNKSLPFSAAKTVFFEVAAKALIATVVGYVGTFSAVIIRPAIWRDALAVLIGLPGFCLLLCAVFFLILVLFPDIDDPTQRAFRSMMNLLAVAVSIAPGILIFLVLRYVPFFALPSPLATIPAALVNVAIAFGSALVAGRLYASYNPSE